MKKLLFLLTFLLLLSISSYAKQAASWYFLPGTDSDKIPYECVDILYIGPGCVMQKIDTKTKVKTYTFGIMPAYVTRFNEVVNAARLANPNIKIIISQWWNQSQAKDWGNTLSQLPNDTKSINQYADGVAEFLSTAVKTKDGNTWFIDGYDVDYESNNVVSYFPAIAEAVGTKLKSKGKLFTVSPAFYYSTLTSLAGSNNYVDYINCQNYGGFTADNAHSLGFNYDQIFYGICSENATSDQSARTMVDNAVTATTVMDKNIKVGELGGVHNWRLNSGADVIDYEIYAQKYLYLKIHGQEVNTLPKVGDTFNNEKVLLVFSSEINWAYNNKPIYYIIEGGQNWTQNNVYTWNDGIAVHVSDKMDQTDYKLDQLGNLYSNGNKIVNLGDFYPSGN